MNEQPLQEQAPSQPLLEQVPEQPLLEQVSEQPLMEQVSEQPLMEQVSGQPLIEQVSGQPLQQHVSGLQESVSGQSRQGSTMGSESTGINCSLCGISVRGQAYLRQHVNKKKCLDRQRKNREQQQQLEASIARMESLRISSSEGETLSTSDVTKIWGPCPCGRMFGNQGALACHNKAKHQSSDLVSPPLPREIAAATEEALARSTDSAPSPTPSRSLTASQSLTKQNICDICFEQFDSTGSLALHHMKSHM